MSHIHRAYDRVTSAHVAKWLGINWAYAGSSSGTNCRFGSVVQIQCFLPSIEHCKEREIYALESRNKVCEKTNGRIVGIE